MRTISDAQLLLGLALAISFIILERCKTLQYHFQVAINLLLVTCGNFLLTLTLMRHVWSWRALFVTLMRLAAVICILLFLVWILALQNASPYRDDRPLVAERSPWDGNKKTDSVIFLPAVCFLDKDFQKSAFHDVSSNGRARIGLVDNHGQAPEWIICFILSTALGITLFVRAACRCGRRRPQLADLPPPAACGRLAVVFWLFIWSLNTAVFIWCAWTVSHLRAWVDTSGWIKPDGNHSNPENDARGFGQVLALASIAGVFFTMGDVVAESGKRENNSQKGSYP